MYYVKVKTVRQSERDVGGQRCGAPEPSVGEEAWCGFWGAHLSRGGGWVSSPRAVGVELETAGRSSSSGGTECSVPLARVEPGPLLCASRAALASGGVTRASFPVVSGAVPARPPSAGGLWSWGCPGRPCPLRLVQSACLCSVQGFPGLVLGCTVL